MIYVIPALTLTMLGYMAWLAAYRLRRDRLSSERAISRGKRGFRPKERIRYLLQRSFRLPDDKPDWEDPLVSSLAVPPPADGGSGAGVRGRIDA